MKRRDLARHLENNGCLFLREGGKHTVYPEIGEALARKICKDLEIPPPR